MQVNLNCNCPKPQFGMAFKKPSNLKAFSEYANLTKGVNRRGLKQLKKEQNKIWRFDLQFKDNGDVDITSCKQGNSIIDTFINTPDQTGFDVFGSVRYPGRKLFARIFNPKKFLPKNLYLAGERAKKLNKAVLKQSELQDKIDKLF